MVHTIIFCSAKEKKGKKKRTRRERKSETELNVYKHCFQFIYIYCCASDRIFLDYVDVDYWYWKFILIRRLIN